MTAALALVVCIDASTGTARADPLSPPASSSSFGPEQRAEELYLDGVEKLSAGHRDFARQTFESVIERFPATEAAEQARHDLAVLQTDAGAGQVSQSFGDVAVTGALPSFGGEPEPETAAPPPARAPTSSWGRELRRNASIQSKLRIEAGDRVFFSSGSSELGSRARAAISAQAQWLKRWRDFEAAIEGHSDEPGSEMDNVELSQQRAEAVRARLIVEGVEPQRIAIVPLGRSVRVATCAESECLAQNRRAVTLVFATGTRERLGLVGTAPVATAFGPATPAIAVPATASVSQAVGMTR